MRAAKIDANQSEIVAALVQHGCSVQSLAGIGCGCPDLLVNYRGDESNILMEVKDGSKSPSETQLTDDQKKFHKFWKGQIYIVYNIADALEIVSLLRKAKS